jgi:hypothetical protein
MSIKTKTLTVELTAEEFGALAGAVSTEWQKRMDQGNAASRYISIRLQDAWMKMLRAWHGPDVEDGMSASSDWMMSRPTSVPSTWRQRRADSAYIKYVNRDDGNQTAEVIPIR